MSMFDSPCPHGKTSEFDCDLCTYSPSDERIGDVHEALLSVIDALRIVRHEVMFTDPNAYGNSKRFDELMDDASQKLMRRTKR